MLSFALHRVEFSLGILRPIQRETGPHQPLAQIDSAHRTCRNRPAVLIQRDRNAAYRTPRNEGVEFVRRFCSAARPLRDPGLRCGWRGWRLLYSAFAETCRAFGRIDFAARLRWLPDLLQPGAITGGADSFGQNFTRFFHYDQSLKQDKKLIYAKIATN